MTAGRTHTAGTPLISVVIPSLNQCRFLEQAIESVLRQEYPALELIVMDGGSTDGTRALLEQHAPSLKYWVSAPDDGPAAALNEGFRHAGGEILAVLNADDYHLPGALAAVAAAFAADPSADVISGHGYFTTREGELGVPAFSDRWSLARFQYGACVLVQPATFFRRAAFDRAGGFRNSGSVCWDMELWADMASRGATFRSVETFLAAFRLHSNSITGRADLRQRRVSDARAVMAAMRGRPETRMDRLWHVLYRLRKFGSHPLRTLRQRAFVFAVLRRWRL